MSFVDRTEEFRLATNVQGSQELSTSFRPGPPALTVSSFSKATSSISNDVSKAALKLQRLTEMVRTKSLFDDKSMEINQLTTSIKADLTGINQDLEKLESFVKEQRATSKQSRDYSLGVVGMLKEELIGTTKDFQRVLETRHENLQMTESRRQKFGSSTPSALGKPIVYQSRQGMRGNSPVAMSPSDDLLPRPGNVSPSGVSFQRSDIVSYDYAQDRVNAVKDIERHMSELGNLFERLSTMISEQGSMIDRLDDNLDAAEVNVNMGYNELIKYNQSISSNRSLIVKLFAVLVVFLLFFLIFLA